MVDILCMHAYVYLTHGLNNIIFDVLVSLPRFSHGFAIVLTEYTQIIIMTVEK